MAQFNWTAISNSGKRHKIGLIHGDRTGHLLVYCDSRIMIVDFFVLRDKIFSFFIDDELYELSIQKKNGRYFYGLEINRDIDIPLNRRRKQIAKKHLKQSLVFFAVIISFVGITLAFNLNGKVRSYVSQAPPKETTGTVSSITETGKRIIINYQYQINEELFNSQKSLDKGQILQGMPIEDGDEFIISYDQNLPSKSHLLLGRPSQNQIQIYLNRTIEKHAISNPNLNRSRIECQVLAVLNLRGTNGLADFYFQHLSVQENPFHNNLSYKKLIRDVPYMELVEKECL